MNTKYQLTDLPRGEEIIIQTRILSNLLDEEENPPVSLKRKLISIGLLGVLVTGGWFIGKELDSHFKQVGYERHMKLPEEKRPYDIDENGYLSSKEEALFIRNSRK